jgi:CheY-like chemotaxis protein
MTKKLNCIMLVDDNHDDNFLHEREIKKGNSTSIVITKNSAKAALEHLRSRKDPRSDLIFLDINMPGMNGWEFLKEYNSLDKDLQGRAVIIMLTTSDNDDDVDKARSWNFISDYITKPLTKEVMEGIRQKYFGEDGI